MSWREATEQELTKCWRVTSHKRAKSSKGPRLHVHLKPAGLNNISFPRALSLNFEKFRWIEKGDPTDWLILNDGKILRAKSEKEKVLVEDE